MITGPLYPFIYSIFLRIFGQEMIVTRILSIIFDSIILFLIYKIMDKIMLGIPNYGYDWTLPYVRGESEAEPVASTAAPTLAYERRARINFDEAAQSPYFSYYLGGKEHIVWFEDARSITAKADLIEDSSLSGAGIWNGMKFFPALWLILNGRFDIEKY